jgi:hypothetical protein
MNIMFVMLFIQKLLFKNKQDATFASHSDKTVITNPTKIA